MVVNDFSGIEIRRSLSTHVEMERSFSRGCVHVDLRPLKKDTLLFQFFPPPFFLFFFLTSLSSFGDDKDTNAISFWKRRVKSKGDRIVVNSWSKSGY